jgi:hypothetical protein
MATDLAASYIGTAQPCSIVEWEDAAKYQGQISSTIRSFGRFRFEIGDGTVKYQYHFWGTDAPSSTYDTICQDASTLPGSKYCDVNTGRYYTWILNESGTGQWAYDPVVILAATGATTSYTTQPPGLIMGHAADDTCMKIAAIDADGDAALN